MKKLRAVIVISIVISLSLAGCTSGSNSELDVFYDDMKAFSEDYQDISDSMNEIDPGSEGGIELLLEQLDLMEAAFRELADASVPEEFAVMETLADEASSYMTEAVSLYRQLYCETGFEENAASIALESYNRALLRIDYIADVLQGELPEGENIIYE